MSFRIAVPGERWEVDFLTDGRVDVEVFTSSGRIEDKTKLDELFARHAD